MAGIVSDLQSAIADIPMTRDAREVLDRAANRSAQRGASETTTADVLASILKAPGSLAGSELDALGVDREALRVAAANAVDAGSVSLRQLLINAVREAEVLGHHQVDSIHLLLAMLYSDTPATALPLQQAGVTLYDLRRHLQAPAAAGLPAASAPDAALRRQPWPSLRGVLGVSRIFAVIVAATAAAGVLLWTDVLPGLTPVWTIAFVVGGWVVSLCLHEFGHALVAYLGGDRSVAAAGYLTLNPLRYANLTMSVVLPVVFLLLGGIALPGGAVYINHSALRTRAWSSAVSLAGPAATALCGLAIAMVFRFGASAMTPANVYFWAALALLGFFMALAVVLNLLPVPGLDGFGVIRPWLPYSTQYALMRYGMIAVYGVFLVLWFVEPVRTAFFQAVYQLTDVAGIDRTFIFIGQLDMRFF